jgi:hypothetical protein
MLADPAANEYSFKRAADRSSAFEGSERSKLFVTRHPS